MTAVPRTIIVVQARMTSTRLPGKVLLPLAGKPSIVRMMERVHRVALAERAVVATSDERSDDELAAACEEHGIACIRGSLTDVLGRVLAAAPAEYNAVVRLTGDCPLSDPSLVDQHVRRYADEQPWAEYVTNAVVRTYPVGLDVEVVRRESLAAAERTATAAADREHVTPWVQRHARSIPIAQDIDLSAMRWVVDTRSDYEAIAAIYEELCRRDEAFTSRMVYELLAERPDLIRTSGAVPVNELIARTRQWLTLNLNP